MVFTVLFMGRRFDEVATERAMLPHQVVQGRSGECLVNLPGCGKTYTPQEISETILAKLKADASAYLGEPVTQTVITVPAYFHDSQRQETKDAGRIAGLDVLRTINDPTTATLSYALWKKDNETILVFDLAAERSTLACWKWATAWSR